MAAFMVPSMGAIFSSLRLPASFVARAFPGTACLSFGFTHAAWSPEEVESAPQLLSTAHAQDIWSAHVADPYATRTELVDVSADDLSCVCVHCSPRVLCVVSDSSLTIVGGSRRSKTYRRVADDIKSCRHQMGVEWVYARHLWGKPLSALVDEAEALVRKAQGEFPHAEIDVCIAWGGNEAANSVPHMGRSPCARAAQQDVHRPPRSIARCRLQSCNDGAWRECGRVSLRPGSSV